MWRPRIKFEHRPVLYAGGLIRIGSAVPGLTQGMRDPDGSVWALLTLLDGSRTVGQIAAELVHRFPNRSELDVREALTALNGAGYLEDAGERWLSEAEQRRYSRARAWWRWVDRTSGRGSWDAQMQLRQARIVLIGVGGAGCAAALALVASGVGQLHCVDPDVVEESNLSHQVLFTEDDLGRAKVDAAQERLRQRNSHVDITAARDHIAGPEEVRALAATCDVVLLAADQPSVREIRSWTNQACLSTRTPWVHTGYHGPQACIGLYRPGEGPCYDCARGAEEYRRTVVSPRIGWPPAEKAVPVEAANAISAGMAGYLAAHAVMSLIIGAPTLPANREYGVNLVTLCEHNSLGLDQPWPHCTSCKRYSSSRCRRALSG